MYSGRTYTLVPAGSLLISSTRTCIVAKLDFEQFT